MVHQHLNLRTLKLKKNTKILFIGDSFDDYKVTKNRYTFYFKIKFRKFVISK